MPDLLNYMEYMHHNSVQFPLSLWRFLYFLTTAILKLNYSGSDGKESACNAGDLGLNPGWGRSPGEGTGNPLQYSCLGNPMSRGAWQATVHGAAKSQMQLSDQHFHFHTAWWLLVCVPSWWPWAFSWHEIYINISVLITIDNFWNSSGN